MDCRETVRLWTPEAYDPDAYLQLTLRRHGDFARYVASTILWRTLSRKDETEQLGGYVYLHSEILQRIGGKQHTAAVMRDLRQEGAIHRTSGYVPGERSYGYKLNTAFLEGPIRQETATDQTMMCRLRSWHKEREAEQRDRWLPVHSWVHRWMPELDIDYRRALEYIETLPTEKNPYGVLTMLIDDWHAKRHRPQVCRYGRFHWLLTRTPKAMRSMLTYRGRPLASIDICNAQPTFLSWMLTDPKLPILREHKGVVPAVASELFLHACASGRLYELLLDNIDAENTFSRDFVKRAFLRDVVAKRRAYPSDVEDIFRRLFPAEYAAIRRLNQHNYKHVICTLQRIESWFVIETVCDRLRQRHPDKAVWTLHDAISTTPDYIDAVGETIDRTAAEMGYRISVKIETSAGSAEHCPEWGPAA